MNYDFPIAAETNFQKIDGFKQHKTILLQFWRAEIQNLVFLGFKVKVSTGMIHSGGSKGEFVSLPFSASLNCGCFIYFQRVSLQCLLSLSHSHHSD